MALPDLDLGPFRLLRAAARGSTAEVWRAAHRTTGVAVAIKVLGGAVDHGGRLGDFAREVRAVAGLDHPHIVRVHDYGTVPPDVSDRAADAGIDLPAGAPYLVMDWHGGGTLGRRGAVRDFAGLQEHLSTVLDALAHAHARGVIHRDLKPANVLLGDGGAVLSDFGGVFDLGEAKGMPRGVLGTPNYMAPEQVTDDWRSFGPWTDLYAVGCIGWWAATGRAPYAGKGPLNAMKGHLRGTLPPFVAGLPVPDGFEDWLRRLLQRPPRARFRFAVDAARALRALTAGTAPAGPLPPVGRPMGPEDLTLLTLDPGDRTTLDASAAMRPLTGSLGGHGAAWSPERPPMAPTPPAPPAADAGNRLLDCGRALAELRLPAVRGRRDAQLLLWRRLADVINRGVARAVVLEGARGVGKSALADWLAFAAHEAGQAVGFEVVHAPTVVDGEALEAALLRRLGLDGLPPAKVADRARERLGLDDYTALSLAALSTPERRATVDGRAVSLGGESATFATLVDALVQFAGDRAVVLRLDGVQWGESALRFARFVLRRRPQISLLMVLTARPGADGAVDRLLDALGEYPVVDRHSLDRLAPAALGEIVDDRLPLERFTRERLLRTADGDPHFAADLTRFWVQTDALEATADGHRVRPDRPDAWPPSPAALWRTRLDHVAAHASPDPLPAFEIAAALGMDVAEDAWAAALDRAGLARPDAVVAELLDAGMLRIGGPGRLLFGHATLRASLIQRARDAGRWRRANLACARGLQILDAETRPVEPGRIAAHYDAAGRPTRAFPLWQVAIDRARIRAGEMTPAVGPVLIAAARCARQTGIRRWDPAFVGLMISWSARCNFMRRGSGLRHARRALEFARRGDDDALQGRALRHLARCLRQTGQLAESGRVLDEAAVIVRRTGDPETLAETLMLQCQFALHQGHFAEAERLGLASIAVRGTRHPSRNALVRNLLGEMHRQRGDMRAAAGCYADALADVGEVDIPLRWVIHINQGLVALALDELDRALESAERAGHHAARSGDRPVRIFAEVLRLVVAAERGLPDEWDRAWSLLAALLVEAFADREFADLVARAVHAAARTMPDRAAAARSAAAAMYRALGDADAAAAIESTAD